MKNYLKNNVIVDISRVGSTETKSLYMGILVMKLQEHRMAGKPGQETSNQGLRHVTVLKRHTTSCGKRQFHSHRKGRTFKVSRWR